MRRRINYAKKARQERRTLFIFLMIGVMMCAYFSLGAVANNENEFVTVIVQPGDTLWEICEENLPTNEDLRDYVYKVKYINEMKTVALEVGQTVILPNS